MSKDKDAPLLDHEYDGIQELDNPLPMWWLVTFFVTIIFGFNYWIHYEFGGGETLKQELAADLAVIEKLKASAPPTGDSEDELAKLAASGAGVLASGESVFQGKCAACHGAHLEGGIGPNLTDEYWLHGSGKLTEISGTVRKGVLDKGMPGWEGLLKNEEIQAVTVFIASRKGSQPANAKAPQGEKFAN